MPNNGTKIYTETRDGVKYGVDVRSDVYKVLGIAPRKNGFDIGYACSNLHGKINPASKHKPIRYDKVGPLTDEERVGSQQDYNEGIFWGVRCAGRIGILDGLHDCNFEYLPPRPGEDWMRLGDFDGYNNAAKFSPRAAVTKIGGGRVDMLVVIERDLLPTGIDVAEIAQLGSSEKNVLDKCYPCILISDTQKKQNWARALQCQSISADEVLPAPTPGEPSSGLYLPMVDDNGTWRERWLAPFSDYSHDGATSPESFLTSADERLITIFFLRYIDTTHNTIDLTKWVEVTNTRVASRPLVCPKTTSEVIVIPKPFGKNINITMITASKLTALKWTYLVSGTWEEPYEAGTYVFTINIYYTKSNGVTDILTTLTHTVTCDGVNRPDCMLPLVGSLGTNTTRFSLSGEIGGGLIDENENYHYTWEVRNDNRVLNTGSGDLNKMTPVNPDLPDLPIERPEL